MITVISYSKIVVGTEFAVSIQPGTRGDAVFGIPGHWNATFVFGDNGLLEHHILGSHSQCGDLIFFGRSLDDKGARDMLASTILSLAFSCSSMAAWYMD